MRGLVLVALAGAAVLLAPAAQSQTYPNRPVTIIVPFGAGSATDTVSRLIAQPLGEALGQNVVVEDRPGADGALAATYVARAAPDGYTLLMASNSPLSAAPFLVKNIAYDAIKDFTPIARTGSYTLMLVVNPKLPVHSVAELVAYAKANPGKLSYASGNTSGIVGGETFKRWAGLDIVHVPYKSTPPALTDVMDGRVSMMFADLITGLPHVRSGGVRALAMTRLKRSALIPELPTMDEAGVEGFEMDSWVALFGPANMPPAIVTRLNVEIRRIIDNPDVQKKMVKVAFDSFSSTPEELGAFTKDQLAKWGKMIKDAGIRAE
jgi:tripartite-type tricarboxylate transporter receptor subunit TctC